MPTYTAQSAVTSAWYMSCYSRNLQKTIQGGDMLYGLETMQFILDEWRNKIPYTEKYTFTDFSQLQNTVFVWVDTVAYIFPNNTVKYLVEDVGFKRFQNQNNVIGLKAIPEIYWFDELKQSINVYPAPSEMGYQFQVYGRPALVVDTLDVPMPSNMPTFMYSALIHEMAFRFAGYRGVDFDQKKNETRLKLLFELEDKREVYVDSPSGAEMTDNQGGAPPYPVWARLSGLN